MGDNGLLKEILDFLNDVDIINFFVEVNGFMGDIDVENRLRELEWENYIDLLWEEFFLVIEFDVKKFRQDDDQLFFSIQLGGGNEWDKFYYIWKKDIRIFKNLVCDVFFKVKFNE